MLDQIIQRIIRIVKFDYPVYREIKNDENATTEALLIVLAASLIGSLGTLFQGGGFGAFLLAVGIAVGGWLLWSWLTMFIGTRMFGGDTQFWPMARILGYAQTPRILGVLSIIPCLGGLVSLAAGIFSLVLGVIGVREALGVPTEKAIITVLIGWVVVFILGVILTLLVLGTAFISVGFSAG
ncbi:MAG TPA: hypothetical protein GX702_13770 [Chloroflexi bacterium]|jgi:hypothetical protein|nr:hypothetical protein [Chloroflexota bacterium]